MVFKPANTGELKKAVNIYINCKERDVLFSEITDPLNLYEIEKELNDTEENNELNESGIEL